MSNETISRDTQAALERAGFAVESVDRFPFSPRRSCPARLT